MQSTASRTVPNIPDDVFLVCTLILSQKPCGITSSQMPSCDYCKLVGSDSSNAGLQPAASSLGLPNRQAPSATGVEPVDPSMVGLSVQLSDADQHADQTNSPR